MHHENQAEKKPAESPVYVEVGCAWDPDEDFITEATDRGGLYVGIDPEPIPNSVKIKNTAEVRAARMAKHQKKYRNLEMNVSFVLGQGEALPLSNNSADRIHARNFFGYGNISARQKLATLHEARRAIKPRGELTIEEEYSPFNAEVLKVLLRRTGFEVSKLEYDFFAQSAVADKSYACNASPAEPRAETLTIVEYDDWKDFERSGPELRGTYLFMHSVILEPLRELEDEGALEIVPVQEIDRYHRELNRRKSVFTFLRGLFGSFRNE